MGLEVGLLKRKWLKCSSFLFLCYNGYMRLARGVTLFLAVLLSVVFASLADSCVFAENNIRISVTPESVEMDLMMEEFGEESQTITAYTSNPAGYTIGFQTNGPSSALINTVDDDYTIPTFVLPSGSESIPVSEIGDGYGYSLDGGSNYFPVPEPGVSTTTIFKTTSAGENTHELTFGTKVPVGTVEGTYTNTFILTIVPNMEPCAAENICYYGNEDDGTGSMPDQLVESESTAILIPSNFSRSGYGFLGWNTRIDGTGTNYGPGQTIPTGDLTNEGLQLYANWIPSAGNLQDWNGCDSMNEGDVTALTDTRDGNTYAVAKYADGKCWMMENLRLDFSDSNVVINNDNTNKPTDSFMTAVNNHPASSNSFCNGSSRACVDRVLYNTNNINRNLTPSYDDNNSSSSWYSYGVYYNYYSATAGNGGFDVTMSGVTVSGDICPAGWRLPTAINKNSDMGQLDIAYGGSGTNQEIDPGGTIGSERWRTYPLNYFFSGEQKENSGYNRGISAGMNSASNRSNVSSFNFWLRAMAVNMSSNNTSKTRGQTVRCVVKEKREITGNIHYDSNGGTGTMADDINVNFATAHAASNQFTKAYANFLGWNTSADGRGITVLENGSVEEAAEYLDLEDGDTMDLYAIWQPYYRVVYDGNNAEAGSMASVTHEGVTSDFYLFVSNYSKSGYGFAGWSPDPDAGTKLLNHEDVTVYGPNQYIRLNSSFTQYADANNQITLYAVWLAADSTDTLQSFSSTRCSAMNSGDVLALTDERDGDTYAIAKLVDNNCWMIENLRLKPSAVTFTSTNTNNPTAAFVSDAPSSVDSRILCNDDDATCIDRILFNANNINRSLTPSPSTNNNSSSWYGYGVMYGWYAATAGNGNYDMSSGNVAGDICPAGWRLPTGGTSGEFVQLTNLVAGSNATATNYNLLTFPVSFIYSGDYNYNISGGRSTYGRFWSATPSGKINAYRMGLATNKDPSPSGVWNKWDGFAVRCIAK